MRRVISWASGAGATRVHRSRRVDQPGRPISAGADGEVTRARIHLFQKASRSRLISASGSGASPAAAHERVGLERNHKIHFAERHRGRVTRTVSLAMATPPRARLRRWTAAHNERG